MLWWEAPTGVPSSPPGGLHHPPQALIPDCSHGMGIFSPLGKAISLLDDKRLFSNWGAQVTEKPLGGVGENVKKLSRSIITKPLQV